MRDTTLVFNKNVNKINLLHVDAGGLAVMQKHDSFYTFRQLCESLYEADGRQEKRDILKQHFADFRGSATMWRELLTPDSDAADRELTSIFEDILSTEVTEQKNVSRNLKCTIDGATVSLSRESCITVPQVYKFINDLRESSSRPERLRLIKEFAPKCADVDLLTVYRVISDHAHADMSAKDVAEIVSAAEQDFQKPAKQGFQKPVPPALAQPCRSLTSVLVKHPEGVLAEVKYDGERVQVHKAGSRFKFFSRTLKPVPEHKVAGCREHLALAFPRGRNFILDAEIVMVDGSGEALPFGTLGRLKQMEHADGQVCMYIFDCLSYNDVSYLNAASLEFRRKILQDEIVPIEGRVVLSEMENTSTLFELGMFVYRTLSTGAEGVVLKGRLSPYAPNKRRWFKMKREHLCDGSLIDTLDLVVLGAYYGTGRNSRKLSVFLMGCLNREYNVWTTVTKVHSGLDDATLTAVSKALLPLMEPAMRNDLPEWFDCDRCMVPDLLAADPEKMPVWEIACSEMKANIGAHTAGVTMRFPRFKRFRPDKDWSTATDLQEAERLTKGFQEKVKKTFARLATTCDGPSPNKKLKLN
ncbi:DNA ligase [Lymantria xylina nucleopolyhedrovirus]|uniref:DNA ligase n=1 Tax=Lymantria xylina multiple nucleopolyhedrovirus TaxID=2847840 RepID=D4N257_9ABAC|nr:DNA ligase [Lymantria xylina nucleopolyhedrovirus]ADD73729.1 DNA ligase [Lymantria xylina nucleopolyhedrovirus]